MIYHWFTAMCSCLVGKKTVWNINWFHIVNGDHLKFVVWKICQTTMFFLLLFVNGAAIPLNILNFTTWKMPMVKWYSNSPKYPKFHMNLKKYPWFFHGYIHWPRHGPCTASCWRKAICLCSMRVKGRVHESWMKPQWFATAAMVTKRIGTRKAMENWKTTIFIYFW